MDPVKAKARRQRWAALNREKHLAAKRKWWANNPEKVRAAQQARDFEKNKEYTRQYRERLKAADGQLTDEVWTGLLLAQTGLCSYCGDAMRAPEIDHRVPLSRGGSNHPENLHLVCGRCNRRKGARTHEEFLDYQARIQENVTL